MGVLRRLAAVCGVLRRPAASCGFEADPILRPILLVTRRLIFRFIFALAIATPIRRPFSGRGCRALTWRSHGHSLAAYL